MAAPDFVATGGCLCGAVRFGLKEKLAPVGFCHCSKCRRVSGAASNAVLNVRRNRFEWLAGQDNVQVHATPTGYKSVPVGVGQPSLKITGLTVGGTAV